MLGLLCTITFKYFFFFFGVTSKQTPCIIVGSVLQLGFYGSNVHCIVYETAEVFFATYWLDSVGGSTE